MSATRRLADLLRSEKCQPHAFVKPPVHHATPLPESLQVTLKYSPSSVAAADRPFIHFSGARPSLHCYQGEGRRRGGIIPRCVTVKPVLDWHKTQQRR